MSMFDDIQKNFEAIQKEFNSYPVAKPLPLEVESIGPLPIALSYSDTQFEILKRYIQDFEATLDKDHEVGLMLTHFGQSVTMVVEEIGYEESVLMVFKGTVNGMPATLIQHVSQLNFLLTSVPCEPDVPKRKIGFSAPQAEEE